MTQNVYMVNSSYNGCCYVRILLPSFHNGFMLNKGNVSGKIDTPAVMQQKLAVADVVVFHRPEEKEFLGLAKVLKKTGKKIVMDNDDTFKIGDHYPLAGLNPQGVKVVLENRDKAIEEFLKIADLVTTTTETLATEYSKLNDNVIILPNCIDPMDWGEPLRNEGDKVRIGMVGSVAYEYDYLHVKDILRELSERKDVELVLFGLGDAEHRKNNPKVTEAFSQEYEFWDSITTEQIPWCPIEDYPRTLNEAKLDMMLIPRKDNYFNRCKSNVKFLEAAMCEIPCICQSFDGAPYEELTHGENGLLVKDNADWLKQTNYLIDNKAVRRRMGINAKDYALNNYNIEYRYQEWGDAYKNLYENRT